MALSNEQVVLELKQLEDSVRRKYQEFKNQSIQSRQELEARYKPLLAPLQRFTEEIVNTTKQEIKQEPKEEPEEEEVTLEEPEIGEDLEKYLNFSTNDTRNKADYTYGVVFDGKNWRMGDRVVHFSNNDIIIDDARFEGTPGLLELIFKKHPDNIFTDEDLHTYKTILMHTKAHEGRDGKVKSNQGYKYTNIISNMFPPRRRNTTLREVADMFSPVRLRSPVQGEGVALKVHKSKIEYKHWDDPNELCERLRLLVASARAGNTSHDNEIISILEELKEARIIKDFDNFTY